MSNRTMDAWEGLLVIIGVVLLGAAAILAIWSIGAFFLMWAWGLFMVPVFALPSLTFTQAFGAIILLVIIRVFGTRSNSGGPERWKKLFKRGR